MRSRSLGTDPHTGVTTIFHPSHDGNTFVIEKKYDTELLLEQNKLIRSQDSGNWRGDMHLVARVPLVVLMGLEERGITRGVHIVDQKAYGKWLNTEGAIWKVKGGRV